MALFEWNISIRDNKKNISTLGGKMNADTSGDAVTALTAIADAVTALCVGVVAKVELTQVLTLSATIPAAGVDNEEGALFTFDDALALATQFRIPAINEAIFLPNSGTVNTANANVLTFINAILNNDVTNRHGQALLSFRSGVESFTKAKKRKG